MPNLSDTDARVLALRLYFIELADGVSPSVAQDKEQVSFLAADLDELATPRFGSEKNRFHHRADAGI